MGYGADEDALTELLEAGITFDDDGHVDGWQIGRGARIADWKFKKEQEEFEALCKQLYQRNASKKHYHKLKERFPEQYQAMLERARRYKREHAAELEAIRQKRRLEEYRRNPVVNTCKQCGTKWCPLPAYHRKLHSDFCGRPCRNRWHHIHVRKKQRRASRQGKD